jgi:hypothetical protein
MRRVVGVRVYVPILHPKSYIPHPQPIHIHKPIHPFPLTPPKSSTCVPNRSRLPIFAPISTPDICPLGPSERWELRARPFGCNVSTLTLLTALVAVAGTLAAVGLGFGIAWAVGTLRRRWRQRKYTCGSLDCVGWGALRRRRNQGRLGYGGNGVFGDEGVIRDDAEARPLLG